MATVIFCEKELDDATLIRQCLDKRQEAFNVLVKRYLRPIYSYICHYVEDSQLAEDLTQETFLRAYRSLGSFDRSRSFKSWLFAIATNVSKSALRRNRQSPVLLHDETHSLNLLENMEGSLACFEEEISDDRLARIVGQSLRKLPLPVRQAIILRHVYDLSYEEVAQAMQANLNTVRTWLKRGREQLRTLFEKNGGLR